MTHETRLIHGKIAELNDLLQATQLALLCHTILLEYDYFMNAPSSWYKRKNKHSVYITFHCNHIEVCYWYDSEEVAYKNKITENFKDSLINTLHEIELLIPH